MMMESLKAKIYGRFVSQQMKKIMPVWSNDDQERETMDERGFNNPQNTVPIVVPVLNDLGIEYGLRIDMVSPTVASEMCEGYRKSMVAAREKLMETRFWLKAAKLVIFGLIVSIAIISVMIMI